MPNLVSLTLHSLQILGKTQMNVFPIYGFLVNPLETKIAIVLEPVMILVSKLDQLLNQTKKTRKHEKTDDEAMSVSCDVNVTFPIFGQF